MYESKIK